MSTYRVTMKVNFLVEINDENVTAAPRVPLQGDTAQAALNRASWSWLRGMQLMKQWNTSLGVRRSFAHKRDWEVVRLEDEGDEAVTPAASQ